MKFQKLLRDNVLVRLHAPERMSASKRLWIPSGARRQDYELYQGTVVETGPGQLRRTDGGRNPVELAKGDRVLFYWLAGEVAVTRWSEHGEEYRVIPESHIQCVLGTASES